MRKTAFWTKILRFFTILKLCSFAKLLRKAAEILYYSTLISELQCNKEFRNIASTIEKKERVKISRCQYFCTFQLKWLLFAKMLILKLQLLLNWISGAVQLFFVILTKCNHISCSSLLVNYRDYNYYDTCQTELQKKREINW